MKRRSSKRCALCGAQILDAYMCADCGRELRELLVGDGITKAVSGQQHPRTQPGIVWYIIQLYKTAYRQTRTGGDVSSKSSAAGYGLLADRRATVLLNRIGVLLREWDDRLYILKDAHHDERVLLLVEGADDYPEALCIRQARFLAAHVRLLRRHDKDVHRLHNQLLSFAREAWTVINRPPELCCGGCPSTVRDAADPRVEKKCGVILYAEENAKTVQCPKCRAKHDVDGLREQLRDAAADYVLPAAELMTLMETRLNDRIPKSSFYQLVRDGRLSAHSERPDGTALYTYQAVSEARTKEPPASRKTHA